MIKNLKLSFHITSSYNYHYINVRLTTVSVQKETITQLTTAMFIFINIAV